MSITAEKYLYPYLHGFFSFRLLFPEMENIATACTILMKEKLPKVMLSIIFLKLSMAVLVHMCLCTCFVFIIYNVFRFCCFGHLAYTTLDNAYSFSINIIVIKVSNYCELSC